MQDPSLSADTVACRRGDKILFRGVKLSMAAGDTLHITGANGIGKSSMIRILAGLLMPYAGTIHRHGTAGLVDERPALDPQLPLGKALAFWSALGGMPEADTEEDDHIRRLGLTDLLDVPVRYLSTGQRKRAAMARLLNQNADIWLLDEPMNGLDTTGVRLVEELIAQQSRAGGIVIVASHQTIDLPAPTTVNLGEYAQ